MYIQIKIIAKMAYKAKSACLYCIYFIASLLLFHTATAQTKFSGLDKWLDDHVKEMGGRAVLLIYKDGIIYSNSENDMTRRQKIAGKMIAKRSGKNPEEVLKDYTPDSRVPIASCSKWLSAALVMTFVDEGKLQLKDTIGKFLPIMTQYGKGRITIQDCLSHMTGIKSGDQKETRELSLSATSMDEAMEGLAKKPMEAEPGTSFHYSSAGLQIAAAVIEKISGKRFKTLFAERIAWPCNMLHTDFGTKPVPLAAGGALSSANDYLNFLVMILNKGIYNGKQVLSKSSVDLMQMNYAEGKKILYTPANAVNWGYGLGEWVIKDANGKASDAVSSPGLFGSFPWVDNKRQYAAILLTFNFKNKGRAELYRSLKETVDAVVTLQ